jgi:hypothetical protein
LFLSFTYYFHYDMMLPASAIFTPRRRLLLIDADYRWLRYCHISLADAPLSAPAHAQMPRRRRQRERHDAVDVRYMLRRAMPLFPASAAAAVCRQRRRFLR